MSSEETVDVAAPAEAAPVVFNVPALAVVGIEQRQHGLRHADYTRYRQYVTRKLHRMRKALKVPQGKHKFSKRPITVATVTDERHLMIPLFLADRVCSVFLLRHRMCLGRYHFFFFFLFILMPVSLCYKLFQ
eukprot:m.94539 g.94539  ORF g.94539 m.94539 type:complete len:132 (-) comp13023_c0_seq3:25159-25554(-)